MTVAEALKTSKTKFEAAGIPSSRLDSELLLAAALNKPKEWLVAHPEYTLTPREMTKFEDYISRRTDREPVCYITNNIEFYGIDFYVDSRVLAPRVETELVAEQAIKNAPKNSKLIDLGTGSGAIAIAIAKNRPDLQITATEVSKDALDVAKKNADSVLGKDHEIKFLLSDIWSNVSGKFEVIVTNLPYVSEDYKLNMKPEVHKEPSVALFGGTGDGLDLYRRFYSELPRHITIGTLVYHESDPWQHEALIKLAKAAGLKPIFEEYLILGFMNN